MFGFFESYDKWKKDFEALEAERHEAFMAVCSLEDSGQSGTRAHFEWYREYEWRNNKIKKMEHENKIFFEKLIKSRTGN